MPNDEVQAYNEKQGQVVQFRPVPWYFIDFGPPPDDKGVQGDVYLDTSIMKYWRHDGRQWGPFDV